jgi:hypothetical protein
MQMFAASSAIHIISLAGVGRFKNPIYERIVMTFRLTPWTYVNTLPTYVEEVLLGSTKPHR